MKSPAFQFYPGDWQRDTALRSCSLLARGLWIEMLCIAFDGTPKGFLRVGTQPIDATKLASLVGVSKSVVARYLAELEAAGVFSRDTDSAIYSRRMVRDEQTRARRAAGGERGASHGIKGAEFGALGGRPKGVSTLAILDEIPPSEPASDPPSERPPASASASARKDTANADTPSAVGGSENGTGNRKHVPRHPRTLELAAYFAKCIRAWKPDARIETSSARSLRALDGLLLSDGRDPERVGRLMEWLFGCEAGDYAPDPGSVFDWRSVVMSGESLRKSWDKLDTLAMRQGAA